MTIIIAARTDMRKVGEPIQPATPIFIKDMFEKSKYQTTFTKHNSHTISKSKDRGTKCRKIRNIITDLPIARSGNSKGLAPLIDDADWGKCGGF